MGIRGHIQTTQADYTNGASMSSWKCDTFQSFLIDKGIDVMENEENGGQWTIPVTGELRSLVKELCENKHNDEINTFFPDENLRCDDNAKELGDFLKCGIDVADKKGYDDIIIDWF